MILLLLLLICGSGKPKKKKKTTKTKYNQIRSVVSCLDEYEKLKANNIMLVLVLPTA